MEFTGERFVPLKKLMDDEIAFEHLHRYHTAVELVKGKTVLDIACGEGYGTAILSEKAEKVFGIDIDQASIEHAKKTYKRNNIKFLNGAADKIPLPDNSIDIVISYETIEHIDEMSQKIFLSETRRVLKKDGVLVISTPDKANYSDRYSHKNEFHIKEFEKEEFISFLENYYQHVSCFLQGYEIIDAITEDNPDSVKSLQVSNWSRTVRPFARKYIIAICSDVQTVKDLHFSSIVFQVNKNYLEIMDSIVDKEAHILELGNWGTKLDKEIEEKNNLLINRQQQLEEQSLSLSLMESEKRGLSEEKLAWLQEEIYFKELLFKQSVTIENLSFVVKEKEQLLLEKKILEQTLFEKVNDIQQLQQISARVENELSHKNTIVATQNDNIVLLEARVEEYARQVQALEETGREKLAVITEVNQKLENTLSDKENILRQQDQKLISLYQQVDQLNNRLSEIYTSEGYRLLSIYYRFKGKYLPEGSPRYKKLKKLFNKIRGKKEERYVLTSFTEPVIAPGNINPVTQFDVLEFPVFDQPRVSVIIPVYNAWEVTHACLESIRQNTSGVSYELIVSDDASTDDTLKISEYVTNIKVVRNEKSLGFIKNCNQAATKAKGEYIFFLNNDTIVKPFWLNSLVTLMDNDEKIGMAGSKLIYPDGRLQEAGGIIWNDASGWNFGNRQDPLAPEFNYVKEVDYISGAAIIVRSRLWKEIGGFNLLYSPAYCEDADLAFEIRKRGYKVIYQPLSEVIHYEGVSHGKEGEEGTIKSYQRLNNEKFREKWEKTLLQDQFPNAVNVFRARDRSRYKKTILVVDHYVPHFDKDAGSKTVFQYLKLFVSLGLNVKFIGDNFYKHEPYTTVLQQMGVEVLYGPWYAQNWQQWVKDNHTQFDYVLLNRPHITIKYIDFIRNNTTAKILYYGHDLHFIREQKQYEIEKKPELLKSAEKWKEIETYIFNQSDIVLAPSDPEKSIINQVIGLEKAKTILPYYFENTPQPIQNFLSRKNILFVGGFTHQPNLDAVLWFIKEVLPILINKIPDIQFVIVGSNMPKQVQDLASPNIIIKGFLTEEQLHEEYSNTRITVIPLRYGAGVKGKTVEALYKAVPLVSTSIGVEGLPSDCSFLDIADEAEAFAGKIYSLYANEYKLITLSKQNADYIQSNFSQNAALNIIKDIFKSRYADMI